MSAGGGSASGGKKIVILGAGYAGVAAARGLEKKFRNSKDVSITLVDKRDYQLFTSNLYEVATAEEELVSQSQLKKSVTIPLKEIFAGRTIEVVQAEVTAINREQKFVQAGDKKLQYDYLAVALGSVSDFFGIQGAENFASTLKTLADGLRARNKIEFAMQKQRLEMTKSNIRIVIAGGGYTGCEFAAELVHELRFMAWKNDFPPEKIEVMIIEAANQLIAGFSNRLSQDALWHLKNLGVNVRLSSPIFKVDGRFVEMATQERVEYDALVWTTGVKACALPFTDPLNLDRKGRIITNQFFQSDKDQSIFALGDCACIVNADSRPAPPTAQDAVAQGEYLAYALPLIMENQKPLAYAGKKHGFIVALGGKWAIFDYAGFYFTGYFAYIFRVLANLRYYASVVGWYKAVKYTIFDWEVYGRND